MSLVRPVPRALRSGVFALSLAVLSFGCGSKEGTHDAAAASPPPAEPGTAPALTGAIRAGTLNHMVLSGTVRDPGGIGIAGASVQFTYLTSTAPGTPYSTFTAWSDTYGNYGARFDAIPDAINGGLAFVVVSQPASFENDDRYISVATRTATVNFTLHPIERFDAGTPVEVTLTPGDPICNNNVQDMHPWPADQEWTCHTKRVLATANGTLHVSLVPTATPTASYQLEVESGSVANCCGTTFSMPVVAGQEVIINPEQAYGATSDQSFTIATSVDVPPPPPPPEPGDPIVYGVVNHIVLTGTVRNTALAPLPGVRIQFNYYASTDVPYPHEAYATTDGNGVYTVEFDTTPDTRWGVAFAVIWGSVYELDTRYVKVPTTQATFDFTLRPSEFVAVGASVSVTLRANDLDPICLNNVMDYHPFDPDYTCHRVRFVAPMSGTVTVQMTPDTTPITDLRLMLDGPDWRFGSFTLSLPVNAGDVVAIDPGMLWHANADQPITISVSM